MGHQNGAGRRALAWRLLRRRARASGGQAMLEFALISPIFLMLIFGVVEFAMINASIGTYNFATQDATRFAAIIGPTDPNADTEMLNQVILPRVQGVVAAQLQSVEVFKAKEDGSCYDGTFAFPCPSIDDDFYNAQTGTWTGTWVPTARSDQLISGDYLGVRITFTYTYITAFFATVSPTIQLSAESVQRVEPQEYTKRHAPQPIVSMPAQASLARALPTLAAPMFAWVAPAGSFGALVARLTWSAAHRTTGSSYVGDRSA